MHVSPKYYPEYYNSTLGHETGHFLQGIGGDIEESGPGRTPLSEEEADTVGEFLSQAAIGSPVTIQRRSELAPKVQRLKQRVIDKQMKEMGTEKFKPTYMQVVKGLLKRVRNF